MLPSNSKFRTLHKPNPRLPKEANKGLKQRTLQLRPLSLPKAKLRHLLPSPSQEIRVKEGPSSCQ